MTDTTYSGGCQCGAVRYTARGVPVLASICHCRMCRHASAAPAVGWATFAESDVRFDQGRPRIYASSAEARRGFCAECGTQISFTASFMPGLIDLTLCSLDDPESIAPTLHIWHSRHLSWSEFADDLPRLAEAPPSS